MKISYNFLQDYFEENLPDPKKIGELLTMHAFEVESIEQKGEDTLLDIKVLPDRSHDCLSHRGIALEVGLFTHLKVKDDHERERTLDVPESNVLRADIEGQGFCRRFSCLVIENIEVKESPDWLKERLKTIGQRPINNIVDATNYVMFALGQPLHAYDRDLLADTDGSWKLVVRKARDGEMLTALDNKEYILTSDTLVIGDEGNGKILGIAGVKGGRASEITKNTKHIVLEAANFEPIGIRKTSKRMGLRTDASVRFENEITPELTEWALRKVSDLIIKIAKTDETQIEGFVDLYPHKTNLYKVGFSVSEVNNLLGVQISESEIEKILHSRGFSFEKIELPTEKFLQTALSAIGTKYKFGASIQRDAPREFDCSSLVAYAAATAGVSIPRISVDQWLYGEIVEESEVKAGDLVFTLTPSGNKHIETREWMPGTDVKGGIDHVGIMLSQTEVLHTSVHNIVGTEKIPLAGFLQNREPRGYRRISALSLGERFVVTIPAERLDLRLKEDMIEEVGRIYGYENVHAKPISPLTTPVEIEKKQYYSDILRTVFIRGGYSEVITYVFRGEGEVELANPIASDKSFLRANLVDGMSEALTLNNHNADLLGISEVKIFEIGNVFTGGGEYTAVAFAGGNTSDIIQTLKDLGVSLDFKEANTIHQANLSEALRELPEVSDFASHDELPSTKFTAYSQYPAVLRDIAVFVPEGQDEAGIIETLKSEAGNLLVNFRLFDTFTKEFPEGKKTSFAYRLAFQSMDKTLSDEEINPIMERATQILNKKSGWQVR